jgi:hypothetical protein
MMIAFQSRQDGETIPLLPKHWLIPSGIEIVKDAGDYRRPTERAVNQQESTTRGPIRWLCSPDPGMLLR